MARLATILIDDDNGNDGCLGCLILVGGLVLLVVLFNFGGFFYQRYSNQKIESRRVRLSPETLDSYAGQYDYNKLYRITIERRGDRLFNKSEEEFCELMPISETDFVYRNCVNGFTGQARFAKDAHGQMVMLIVHKDGREDRAARLK